MQRPKTLNLLHYTALPILLLLGSCQPPPYEIVAQNKDDEIVFHARDDGFFGQPFGWNDESYSFARITVFSGNHIYWQVEQLKQLPETCAYSGSYPLTYSAKRCDYKVTLASEQLKSGRKYRIVSEDILEPDNDEKPSRIIDPDHYYAEGRGLFSVRKDGSVRVFDPG